jgi:NADPH-dependent ferric siderophore reductase
MTVYALINPQGAIDRQQSNIDPTVQTKTGWKWLAVDEAAAPAHVAALETVTPTYVVSANAVTRQWSKTRRSLDEQKAAVKAEAQRRIIALTGRMSLMDCMIKQSNANMRANELNDKRVSGGTLTAEEETEATALRNLATAIKAIRSKSNDIELMDPIPLDYTADGYWV